MPAAARDAWLAWYATTPDAPCIAICSTSQGDAVCKGCGRTFDEVQHWPEMTPAEKRATWRRITLRGHRLALQPLRRARAPGRRSRRRPAAADAVRAARRRLTAAGPALDERAPHRAAGLAGVHRPGRGARLRHRRHGDGRRATSAIDLAALAVGGAAYITGLHRPDGRRAGGRPDRRPAVRRRQAARSRPRSCTRRCGWRSALSVLGLHAAARFRSPSSPCRAPSRRSPTRCAATCSALAFALPPALLFTAYRGFNIAVSRPKAVMALQLGGAGAEGAASTALFVFGVPRRSAWRAGAGRAGLRHRDRDRRCGCSWWRRGGAAARPVLRAVRRSAAASPRPTRRASPALLRLGVPMGAVDPDRGHRLHLHGVLHRALRRDAGGRAPDRGQPGRR